VVLITEYCPNRSLQQLYQDKKQKANFTEEEFLKIAQGILKALTFLHKHEFVHRDLSMDNILFNEHNEPLISDFGTLRHLSKKTTKYGFVGKERYMPEEVRLSVDNPYPNKTDEQKFDIFSLGVIFYELCTMEYDYLAIKKKKWEKLNKVSFNHPIMAEIPKMLNDD